MRRAVAAALLCAACVAPLAQPSPTASVAPTVAPTAPATATPARTSTATPSPPPTPSLTPTPSPTPRGPAEYCQVADVPTPITAFADHAQTRLDWTNRLPETYVPPDLVLATSGRPFIVPRAVEAVGAAEVLARRGDPSYSTLFADAPNAAIRAVAYADLSAMRGAALVAGHPLVLLSSYRSYSLQVETFDYWVRVGGYEQALRTSARPGHSEHQLGTAIDFGDGTAAPWEYADWATTDAGAWLAGHAAEFGFVLSFPRDKTNVTCYAYEPWHYRYVGRELAQTISETRVTLREYQAQRLR